MGWSNKSKRCHQLPPSHTHRGKKALIIFLQSYLSEFMLCSERHQLSSAVVLGGLAEQHFLPTFSKWNYPNICVERFSSAVHVWSSCVESETMLSSGMKVCALCRHTNQTCCADVKNTVSVRRHSTPISKSSCPGWQASNLFEEFSWYRR